MFKSPLIIGADITKISASSLAILKNADVIAINQDSLGKAATTFQPKGQPAPGTGIYPYWAGPLSDGVVVGMVALNGAATMSVNFSDVPGLGAGTFVWKELYTGKTGSGTSVSATLVAHDMVSTRYYSRLCWIEADCQLQYRRSIRSPSQLRTDLLPRLRQRLPLAGVLSDLTRQAGDLLTQVQIVYSNAN